MVKYAFHCEIKATAFVFKIVYNSRCISGIYDLHHDNIVLYVVVAAVFVIFVVVYHVHMFTICSQISSYLVFNLK